MVTTTQRNLWAVLPIAIIFMAGAVCAADQPPFQPDEGTTGSVHSPTGSLSGLSGSGDAGSPLTRPPPPTAFPAVTSITVRFDPPQDKRAARTPELIHFEMSDDNQNFNALGNPAPYGTASVTADNLAPSTFYYFRVFSSDSYGNSAPSDSTQAKTGAADPSTNSTGAAAIVGGEQSQTTGGSSSGLGAGAIAGIVIAAVAVVAAIVAVSTKAAMNSATPAATHWLDNVAQNPLYVEGEQAFENPMYEPPSEARA